MKKGTKKWIIICAVILIAAAGIACWLIFGKEKPKAAESAGGAFRPALDTQITGSVNVVGHYDNFEALEAEFNLFNQIYPNVELKYTKLDNYSGTIGAALHSEEAPDIFFMYPSTVQRNEEAVMGAAENLADEKLGMDLSCVRSGILYRDAEGQVPYVPIYAETYGMLVNEDLFKKEQIEIPKTYSQLLEACEKLKAAGYAGPMMGYNDVSYLTFPLFYPYFCAGLQGNEEAVNALNAMGTGAGEYARSALELAADLYARGCVDLEASSQLEKDYDPVILRFFEGDVPMMLAKAGTVSGTQKRESKSEAFTAHPFRYSFRPVPSTEEGGYFLDVVSMGFAVNRNSKNLDLANEFMRFMVRSEELNRIAQAKRMVTTSSDMSLDAIYSAFGELSTDRIINPAKLGLIDAADAQVRRAGWQVSNGKLTVDEAIAAFGTLE